MNEITDEMSVDDFFSQFNEQLSLDELERATSNRFLETIVDLRLTCNHPQLILRKPAFNGQNKPNVGARAGGQGDRLLTMEASLKILMKKTQSECDNLFRTYVFHLNGLAGLKVLRNEREQAMQIYESVLHSAENDFGGNVQPDKLQKVHALHNYLELMRENKSNATEITKLEKEMNDIENEYLLSFDERKSRSDIKYIEKEDLVKRQLVKVALLY